jgi:glycosyltransferase involved in cell wall biosynthesis
MVVNRLLLRKQDRLIGCGAAVGNALIENEGLPAARVETIYNGVDLDALSQPEAGARLRIRQEFGFDQRQFVVVQVARLHELKDHQTALRAFDRVRDAIPDARLLLVGEGDQRSAIEASVASLGLHQHVVLAGSRNDVADILAAADAFLMTSISEGIPLTIIEAMAARIPVVSTAVGGIPEMIKNAQTGFLAPSGDVEFLAAALIHLHRHPNEALAMAQRASEAAWAKFSLDGMLAGYRKVYHEIMAAQGVSV